MKNKFILLLISFHLGLFVSSQKVNVKLLSAYDSSPITDFKMNFLDDEGKLVETKISDENGNIQFKLNNHERMFAADKLDMFMTFSETINSKDTNYYYFYPTEETEEKIRNWEDENRGKRLEDLSILDNYVVKESNQKDSTDDESQSNTDSHKNESDKFVLGGDTEPSFPGGINKMYEFLQENIHYPTESMERGVEGTAYIQFIVEKNGLISQITVLRGVSREIDAESIRVVRKMPKWTPGISDGENVRVRYTLPLIFRLN